MVIQIEFELMTPPIEDDDKPCGACEALVLSDQPAVKYEVQISRRHTLAGLLHVDCAPSFVRKKFADIIKRCERAIEKDQCPTDGGCSACPIAEEMEKARVVFRG